MKGDNTEKVIRKSVDFEKKFRKSVLVLKGDKIYRINETGKLIWEFLDKISVDDMVKVISEEKGIPEDTIRAQIENFIDELEKNGLIEFVQKKKKREKSR